MASPWIVFGIIISGIILALFVVPLPMGIPYCDVEFFQNTAYEIQMKCWER